MWLGSGKFWRAHLTGFTEPTRMGLERGATTAAVPRTVTVTRDTVLAGRAPEHVVLGAIGLVLSAHAGTDDVVFGVRPSGSAGDPPAPLRMRIDHGMPLTGFLATVRSDHEQVLRHGPPDPVELATTGLADPLFDKVVRFGAAPADPSYPLEVQVLHGSLRLHHRTDRLSEQDAGTLLVHIDRMLTAMAGAGERAHLHDLSVLSEREHDRIVREWNATTVERSEDELATCIHELFERQAARTPDAVAVLQGDERFSYAELDSASDRLARQLAASGVGPGDFVALYLRRTVHLVVAVLGVLKAGAAYAPIEPSLPTERVRMLFDSLSVPVVITDPESVPDVAAVGRDLPALRRILWLGCPDGPASPEAGWGLAEPEPGAPAPRRARADDLAYVIFTSGSTGTPKGVLLTHAPVVNLIRWVNGTFGMGPADRVLFITSLGFDLSVYDIFGVLASGGSIRVATADEVRDPARLLSVLDREPITFWDSAPAALQQLEPLFALRNAPTEHSLRLVFLSGDWVPITLPGSVRAAFGNPTVVALGGATEAAIWSNFHVVGEVDPEWPSIPYGRPIDNARYYILDGGLRPAVVGAPGDLYIGGDCLAVGYHGDPALTAGKFVPDPFGGVPGARLYRTGDRARFWPDGTIEFLGRQDHQVKIRGFRVELGEIEAALVSAPDVISAVAVVREPGASAQLVAYVVPEPGASPSPELLRERLARRLPEYMVPAHVLVLDELPVTANGKLDRRALPPPGQDIGGDFVEPSTPTEKVVADIWSEVLGVDRVGVHDNFFSLGGHSLLITQLTARLNVALEVDVPPAVLVDNQTLGGFAGAVEAILMAEIGGMLDER